MRKAALATIGLLALVGLLLLWPAARNPMFTKFALGMVESVQAPGDGPAGSLPGDVKAERSWSEILSVVETTFPTPSGQTRVPPFRTPEALLAAIAEGAGECSTWTEGLMVLCEEEGLICREWALVPEPESGASGHAVVDIWSPEAQRWAMFDVYLGFWAQREDGTPMSAPEFEAEVLASKRLVGVEWLSSRSPDSTLATIYYADPRSRLVEMRNNHPTALMRHWTRRVEQINKPMGQLLQRMLGLGPRYEVTAERPGPLIEAQLVRYRTRTIGGLLCFVIALLIATVLLWTMRGRSPASARPSSVV